MGNWFWSTRGEGNTFSGPFDSKKECILEAQAETGKPDGFFVGQSHTVEVVLDADQAIEWWACDGHEALYEDAMEHWCQEVPQVRKDALTRELSSVFIKHLKKWGEDFSWKVITDPEQYVSESAPQDREETP